MSEGSIGIHVGTQIGPKGFESLTKAIPKVATVSPFEDVNLAALDALKAFARVENVSISNSSVTMGERSPFKGEPFGYKPPENPGPFFSGLGGNIPT